MFIYTRICRSGGDIVFDYLEGKIVNVGDSLMIA